MSDVGVAVFGCGRMGRQHLKTLSSLPSVKVLWIVEDEKFHEQVHSFLLSLRISNATVNHTGDTDCVFKDIRVNAVLICTPWVTHESLILLALQNGKHVFCEKPLAGSSESVRSSYRMAREKGLTLYCGFQRECDQDFQTVHSKIQAGEVGKLRIIKITSRDSPGHNTAEFYKNSGGIFLDSCVHDLHIAYWMAGERPQSVVAFGHAHDALFQECNDLDFVSIMIKFPSGAIATIDNSRTGSLYGYDQRMEVLGSGGMLRVENPRVSTIQEWKSSGTLQAPMLWNGIERYVKAYEAEVIRFIDIIQGTSQYKQSIEAVIATSELIELCQESVKTGKTMTLPPNSL